MKTATQICITYFINVNLSYMRKAIAVIIVLAIIGTSCNPFNTKIDGDKVVFNDSTITYTYKEDGKKVTGIIEFYELDPITSKKYKKAINEVKDGKRANKGYAW